MTWFFLAAASAILLGFYDVFKKQSLRDNAVVPVLLINTALSSLLFLPLLSGSQLSWISPDSRWYIPPAPLTHHLFVMGKAVLVLSSWVCGYFAIKHLPLTLVGPINATRPVMTLMGALLIYHNSTLGSGQGCSWPSAPSFSSAAAAAKKGSTFCTTATSCCLFLPLCSVLAVVCTISSCWRQQIEEDRG